MKKLNDTDGVAVTPHQTFGEQTPMGESKPK
jgi:hypothetical protein